MAKTTKRMLHPEIWLHPDFGEMPPESRLLYIGLITIANDDGIMEYEPRRIKAMIFPYDGALDVEVLLAPVVERGLITDYTVDGQRYLAHPHWTDYQTISPSRRHKSGNDYPGPPAAKKKKKQAPAKKKEPYQATPEARRCRATWHRMHPLKDKYRDEQLKILDEIHRIDGLPWADINAICKYACDVWVPKSFCSTPSTLRDKKSGEDFQWEKIQRQLKSGHTNPGTGLEEIEEQL